MSTLRQKGVLPTARHAGPDVDPAPEARKAGSNGNEARAEASPPSPQGEEDGSRSNERVIARCSNCGRSDVPAGTISFVEEGPLSKVDGLTIVPINTCEDCCMVATHFAAKGLEAFREFLAPGTSAQLELWPTPKTPPLRKFLQKMRDLF